VAAAICFAWRAKKKVYRMAPLKTSLGGILLGSSSYRNFTTPKKLNSATRRSCLAVPPLQARRQKLHHKAAYDVPQKPKLEWAPVFQGCFGAFACSHDTHQPKMDQHNILRLESQNFLIPRTNNEARV
jgi:hypothetical protein